MLNQLDDGEHWGDLRGYKHVQNIFTFSDATYRALVEGTREDKKAHG